MKGPVPAGPASGSPLPPGVGPALPLLLPEVATYDKESVFEVCDTLAEAERTLTTRAPTGLGRRLADALMLLEAGLCGLDGAGCSEGGCRRGGTES